MSAHPLLSSVSIARVMRGQRNTPLDLRSLMLCVECPVLGHTKCVMSRRSTKERPVVHVLTFLGLGHYRAPPHPS